MGPGSRFGPLVAEITSRELIYDLLALVRTDDNCAAPAEVFIERASSSAHFPLTRNHSRARHLNRADEHSRQQRTSCEIFDSWPPSINIGKRYQRSGVYQPGGDIFVDLLPKE